MGAAGVALGTAADGVRLTFGTVLDRYQERAHSDVAFENQFYQRYYVRRPRD